MSEQNKNLAQIRTLIDGETIVYPRTLDDAVFISDQNNSSDYSINLKQKFEQIDSNINNKGKELESKIDNQNKLIAENQLGIQQLTNNLNNQLNDVNKIKESTVTGTGTAITNIVIEQGKITATKDNLAIEQLIQNKNPEQKNNYIIFDCGHSSGTWN